MSMYQKLKAPLRIFKMIPKTYLLSKKKRSHGMGIGLPCSQILAPFDREFSVAGSLRLVKRTSSKEMKRTL